MKIMNNWLVLSLIAGMALSCSQKTGQKQSAPAEPASNEFAEKLAGINPGLKDPSGVAILLEMAGADYLPGLVNPMENVDYYAQDKDLAALNLGIYTVDIAYLVAYDKKEEALAKYERARKLAATVGLQSAYEKGVFERYKAMSVHPDTLLKNLTMSTENLDVDMSNKEMSRLVTLFVTGEFIEKMYVATQVVKQYPSDLPEDVTLQLLRNLLIIIAGEEDSLDNLLELLNEIREGDEGQRFFAEFNKLKEIYKKADFKEYIRNYKPGTEYASDRDYITQITDQIDLMRTGLISTEPRME